MKDPHPAKIPCNDNTLLKKGNKDVSISLHKIHNQPHEGEGSYLLNINVIVLQSESSLKLLSPLNIKGCGSLSENLHYLKPGKRANEIIDRDFLELGSIPKTNTKILWPLNDLENISEEDERESLHLNSISSESDVFYSLEGSDYASEETSNETTEVSKCLIKINDILSSTCSTTQFRNMVEDNDKLPQEHQSEDTEKNHLTPNWENENQPENNNEEIINLERKSGIFSATKCIEVEELSAMVNISGRTSQEHCEIQEFLSCGLSDTDLLIAVYSDEEELGKVLHKSGGVTGYVKNYWMGFFPILLVHISEATECGPVNEVHTTHIVDNYSSCHRIIIQNISNEINFLFQTIVRFYLHIHYLQCTHLVFGDQGSLIKSLSNCQWKCPGLCQLQTLNPEREEVRNKKRRTFFQSVRRSMSVRRATRKIRSRSMKTQREKN